MARKLASIQKIISVSPIPNSDNLEVAQVLGWQCVVKKGDFQPGDLCVYFEVDSFLPIAKEYEFLRKSCYKNHPEIGEGFRLKTIRLRGQISQGLVMSLSDVFSEDTCLVEGTDLTEMLGVKLYAPPVPACLKGIVKSTFPSFIPKTDETRVQVLQSVLTRHKGVTCHITEKIDGTSVTYYLKDGVFGVCSRNQELLDGENAYWEMAHKYDVETKLRRISDESHLKNVAIQGEIYGLGIQGNSLKLSERRLAIFNLFDIGRYEYLPDSAMRVVMDIVDLPVVPMIELLWPLSDNIPELLKMAEGKSLITPTEQREGIVIRPNEEILDLQMSQGMSTARLSFKAVSQEYLLTHDG